jgi:HAD superfamily hydrolase (TIGR01549 family)
MKLEQPQAFRTIFFDAGLTLLYPHPSISEICLQICQRLDVQVDLAQIQAQMKLAEDYYFRQMRVNRHTWADEQAINEFWIGYYMQILRPFVAIQNETHLHELASGINDEFDKHTSWRIFSDVHSTLTTLRAHGYSLGIISDWGISLAPILRHHHLITYFDCLIISAATRSAKPSPQLYETALQRANAIPDYTLHIGDSYINDIIGARTVGITPILLDRAQRYSALNVDCLVIHSLTDVLDLLEVEPLEREQQNT